MRNIDFIAIDFETATGYRHSICEAGICVVKGGEVVETRSWLVRPENNYYNFMNIQIHGITPRDTEYAPDFPEVWDEIMEYLEETPVLVAHNASFDMSCIRKSLDYWGMEKPEITYFCSLKAARYLYDFCSNTLDNLCYEFDIPCGTHHRAGDDAEMCARLFLQEIEDAEVDNLGEMDFCCGVL